MREGSAGHFTEMCSGSEAGSYLRLIDFVYHSTLGVRVIKKKKKRIRGGAARGRGAAGAPACPQSMLLQALV